MVPGLEAGVQKALDCQLVHHVAPFDHALVFGHPCWSQELLGEVQVDINRAVIKRTSLEKVNEDHIYWIISIYSVVLNCTVLYCTVLYMLNLQNHAIPTQIWSELEERPIDI